VAPFWGDDFLDRVGFDDAGGLEAIGVGGEHFGAARFGLLGQGCCGGRRYVFRALRALPSGVTGPFDLAPLMRAD
jgi:hypothetical protein